MNLILAMLMAVACYLAFGWCLKTYQERYQRRHPMPKDPAYPKPNAGDEVRITRPFGGNTIL